MKNNFFGEILISLFLIGLLLFYINPLYFMMPEIMHPLMIPVLLVIFIIFGATVWREAPGDEREQLHKYISSRFAYFAGIAVLILAIILQTLNDVLDPWLVITACSILLAKLIGIIYGHLKH